MKTALAFAATILIAASHLSAQEGIWQTYTRANSGLIGDSVSSITFDQTGTVWLAARQGVAKQVGEGWLFFNTAEYMPSDEIWDMDFTNNRVWSAHRVGITAFDGIA